MVALLIGIGVIVALTFLGSYRYKLMRACKKIIRYLSGVDAIDNDNFGDFTAQCFSAKAPSALRDCWVQYLGVRFGYPSDIVSEQNVYDKEVKRVREIRANVYIAIALILIAVFAFWGYGRLEGNDMGVIFLASLLLSGVIYLVLVILNKALSTKCLFVFNNMQEDLDAKVVFQVEKSFATDSSPLADLSAIIDEIVARNTAKEIGFEFADEQTPIEELIAKTSEANADNAESGADNENDEKSIDDVIAQAEEFVKDDGREDEVKSAGTEPVLEGIVEEAEPKKDETEHAEDIVEEEPDDAVEGVVAEAEEASVSDESVSEDSAPLTEEVPTAEEKPEEPAEDEAEVIASETISPEKAVIEDEPAEENGSAEENVEDESVVDNETDDNEENSAEAEPEVRSDEEPKVSYVSDDETQKKNIENEPTDPAEESAPAEGENSAEPSAEQNLEHGEEDAQEEPAEPVVRYVVDGPGEDDEIVKPAKLVKMPNLVDYVIAQNMSNKVKMNLATMLMSTYKKFESSEEDKKIIKDCVRKLMANLQNNK